MKARYINLGETATKALLSYNTRHQLLYCFIALGMKAGY